MALIRAEFMSYTLQRIVPITVILPCDTTNFLNLGPEPARPPYKTLYLLHGIYGSDMDWVANTNIHRLAREHQLAVVMPSGENHFYTDADGTLERFGSFIGEELVEVTRRMFQLSDKREDTYLAGLSMGGYGAFMNGIKYWQTFSYVAGLSMAIIDERCVGQSDMQVPLLRDPNYIRAVFGEGDLKDNRKTQRALIEEATAKKITFPELYLTIGKDDALCQANVDLHEYLQEKNVKHIFKVEEGKHNFEFWGKAIEDILNWLPKGELLQK